MKQIIKQEFKEDKNGIMYEITQFKETIEYEDVVHIKHSQLIMKAPFQDDVGEISNDTKSIIDAIKHRGTN